MASIKETIRLKVDTAAVGLQEAGVTSQTYFQSFPKWQRVFIIVSVVGVIPGFFAARYGVEQIFTWQYSKSTITAHQAFVNPVVPTVSEVSIITTGTVQSAYVIVQNENLDLSAQGVSYEFAFHNSSNEQIATTRGTMFLLPNQKKYLTVPRIATSELVTHGTLTIGSINWLKRLDIPTVELKTSDPFLYDEANPLTLYAEGSVINSSPYELQTVRLTFLLFNATGRVIAVSQRDEFKIPAFGRRAYKQQWPGLYHTDVARVQVVADTNTLDGNNILVDASVGGEITTATVP